VPPEPHLDEAYDYQWDVAVEYWRDLAAFADDHGVDVAVEPHLNTLVHTPGDLLRLREATNDRVGAKLDPAHLFLQGIDEVEAVRTLGREGAIHAFEASDAVVHGVERRRKGVLDMTPLSESIDRSWDFRAPGNGHDEAYWRELVATLELVGFEGPLSIQHLNSPRPLTEGFERSAAMFRELL
jgi:sugar phosphate isomerase/epimerase